MGIDANPGVDPNMAGGAECIFVNAANVEVCYNNFLTAQDLPDGSAIMLIVTAVPSVF
jgi:hypothetical protein